MKKSFLYALACVCALSLSFSPANAKNKKELTPEEKGLATINMKSAQSYVGFLASDELEGREAGWRGANIASAYIASLLYEMGYEPLFDSYFQPFEAHQKYIVQRKKMRGLQVDPDSIIAYKNFVHQNYKMRNVLVKLEGKRKDEIVVIGTHFDHLGIDPMLEGDQIYNGADDNASGVQAVLQIARAFKATGVQPERTVIFAFWDGEEKGLLGSKYFVQSFKDLDKVKGYLNFDMIGRNLNDDPKNSEYVVYFFTESKPIFGEWLKKDIEKYNLKLKPEYRAWDRPIGGSDNGSFAKHDVPIMWYHTDWNSSYHMPDDEPDKINWDKCLEITKASFLGMWKMANLDF